MQLPAILDNEGTAEIFDTLDSLLLAVEPEDVRSSDYVIYDSVASVFRYRIEGTKIAIQSEQRSDPKGLRALLLRKLTWAANDGRFGVAEEEMRKDWAIDKLIEKIRLFAVP